MRMKKIKNKKKNQNHKMKKQENQKKPLIEFILPTKSEIKMHINLPQIKNSAKYGCVLVDAMSSYPGVERKISSIQKNTTDNKLYTNRGNLKKEVFSLSGFISELQASIENKGRSDLLMQIVKKCSGEFLVDKNSTFELFKFWNTLFLNSFTNIDEKLENERKECRDKIGNEEIEDPQKMNETKIPANFLTTQETLELVIDNYSPSAVIELQETFDEIFSLLPIDIILGMNFSLLLSHLFLSRVIDKILQQEKKNYLFGEMFDILRDDFDVSFRHLLLRKKMPEYLDAYMEKIEMDFHFLDDKIVNFFMLVYDESSKVPKAKEETQKARKKNSPNVHDNQPKKLIIEKLLTDENICFMMTENEINYKKKLLETEKKRSFKNDKEIGEIKFQIFFEQLFLILMKRTIAKIDPNIVVPQDSETSKKLIRNQKFLENIFKDQFEDLKEMDKCYPIGVQFQKEIEYLEFVDFLDKDFEDKKLSFYIEGQIYNPAPFLQRMDQIYTSNFKKKFLAFFIEQLSLRKKFHFFRAHTFFYISLENFQDIPRDEGNDEMIDDDSHSSNLTQMNPINDEISLKEQNNFSQLEQERDELNFKKDIFSHNSKFSIQSQTQYHLTELPQTSSLLFLKVTEKVAFILLLALSFSYYEGEEIPEDEEMPLINEKREIPENKDAIYMNEGDEIPENKEDPENENENSEREREILEKFKKALISEKENKNNVFCDFDFLILAAKELSENFDIDAIRKFLKVNKFFHNLGLRLNSEILWGCTEYRMNKIKLLKKGFMNLRDDSFELLILDEVTMFSDIGEAEVRCFKNVTDIKKKQQDFELLNEKTQLFHDFLQKEYISKSKMKYTTKYLNFKYNFDGFQNSRNLILGVDTDLIGLSIFYSWYQRKIRNKIEACEYEENLQVLIKSRSIVQNRTKEGAKKKEYDSSKDQLFDSGVFFNQKIPDYFRIDLSNSEKKIKLNGKTFSLIECFEEMAGNFFIHPHLSYLAFLFNSGNDYVDKVNIKIDLLLYVFEHFYKWVGDVIKVTETAPDASDSGEGQENTEISQKILDFQFIHENANLYFFLALILKANTIGKQPKNTSEWDEKPADELLKMFGLIPSSFIFKEKRKEFATLIGKKISKLYSKWQLEDLKLKLNAHRDNILMVLDYFYCSMVGIPPRYEYKKASLIYPNKRKKENVDDNKKEKQTTKQPGKRRKK